MESTSTKAGPRISCRSGLKTFASLSPAPPTRRMRARSSAAASFWDRVSGRTRSVLAAGLRSLKPPLAPGYYEELEEVLVAADIGPAMAARLVAAVKARAPRTREEAADALVAGAVRVMSIKARELDLNGNPACLLFYGINGAGKTTTIGKLAHRLKQEGRKPMIVAADTFRAALTFEVVDAGSARPGGHLLDAGGAEGVGGDDHWLAAFLLEAVGELADRCGLARAVDAVEEQACGIPVEIKLASLY